MLLRGRAAVTLAKRVAPAVFAVVGSAMPHFGRCKDNWAIYSTPAAVKLATTTFASVDDVKRAIEEEGSEVMIKTIQAAPIAAATDRPALERAIRNKPSNSDLDNASYQAARQNNLCIKFAKFGQCTFNNCSRPHVPRAHLPLGWKEYIEANPEKAKGHIKAAPAM